MDLVDPVMGMCFSICEMIDNMKANKERCQQIIKRIKALQDLVIPIKQRGSGQISAPLENALQELFITVNYVNVQIKKYSKANNVKSFMKSSTYEGMFAEMNEKLTYNYQILSAALQVEHRNVLEKVFEIVSGRPVDEGVCSGLPPYPVPLSSPIAPTPHPTSVWSPTTPMPPRMPMPLPASVSSPTTYMPSQMQMSSPTTSMPPQMQMSSPTTSMPSQMQMSSPTTSMPPQMQMSSPTTYMPPQMQMSSPTTSMPSQMQMSSPTTYKPSTMPVSSPTTSMPSPMPMSSPTAPPMPFPMSVSSPTAPSMPFPMPMSSPHWSSPMPVSSPTSPIPVNGIMSPTMMYRPNSTTYVSQPFANAGSHTVISSAIPNRPVIRAVQVPGTVTTIPLTRAPVTFAVPNRPVVTRYMVNQNSFGQ